MSDERNVRDWVSQLRSPDNKAAYCALKELVKASGQSGAVYAYLGSFISMMRDSNSYVRTRGLTLIACNARWDAASRIDGIIDEYLQHATDESPITARQCVRFLRQLAEAKPALAPRIADALRNADVSKYSDSMRPLVQKDIREALLSLDGRAQRQVQKKPFL